MKLHDQLLAKVNAYLEDAKQCAEHGEQGGFMVPKPFATYVKELAAGKNPEPPDLGNQGENVMSESVIANAKRWGGSCYENESVKQCCKHVLAIQPGDLIGLRAVLAELNASDEHFSACQSHVLADAALLRFIDDIGVADLHEQLAPYFE